MFCAGLEANNSQQGNPFPGPQSPKPAEATESQYFVSHKEWEELRDPAKFDFIVVGSGLTALAFVEKVRKSARRCGSLGIILSDLLQEACDT